uniref:Next to BRCA1 gene 1 protein n=1 Tax=Sphenodon punctatus TaxID=8508 RepID=A0A8D0GBL1_SPHPU
MDPQVNLSVTFQGKIQNFLISDSSNTTWADVEAMVKVSFDLNSIQIKYVDEDNDEVSVNSAEEYEEALKIAAKQGNQLQMNVYDENPLPDETSPSCSAGGCEKTVLEKPSVPRDGKKPLSHYSVLAQALGQDIKAERETVAQFREQVVKETVEKLEQKLSEKLVLPGQTPDSLSSSLHHGPESESTQGNPFDWLISCSNCQTSIVGIRYQCSVCPAYSICEPCEAGAYAHDPNHVLLKLRRPILCVSETYNLGQFSPRLATLEQVRLQKQMDKRFLKAEKQRIRAEKKQRKAEVRELKKQLKLHRKIHLWNSVHALDAAGSPAGKPENLQPNALLSPIQPCPVIVPTLSAAFVDENLPDGTHLRSGMKFIKHWRMKNTGNVEWSSDTKLKFMWGNLALASSEKKDVMVPSLPPGQVGLVSVEFVAPALEGTYTSHWRLSHRGEQFGPRIWCSIVVDPSLAIDCLESSERVTWSSQKNKPYCKKEEAASKLDADAQQAGEAADQGDMPSPAVPLKIKTLPSDREFYIPSVDLLTAQDLLSFELLDINIVQELERVPHNTPVDMTPCMSPLPHDSPLIEKPGLGQIEEESEGSGFKPLPDAHLGKVKADHPASQEEGDEDMSGTQFVCETVIRSLTLDAAPDHNPLQRKKSLQKKLAMSGTNKGEERSDTEDGETNDDDVKDDVRSQASSSSSEDYIIILPECFDISRPLGESMYSSALSQPSLERAAETGTEVVIPEGESQSQPRTHSINDMLTTSQTLDAEPLTPQVVNTLPQPQRNPFPVQNPVFQEQNFPGTEEISSAVSDQIREEPRGEDFPGLRHSGIVNNKAKCPEHFRHPQGSSIAGGLVKGALSVAASAYKALFSGQPIPEQEPASTEEQTAALLASLSEMGFCDRQLNLRLLRKHNCNIAQVVNELLQINNDWYSSRY